MPLCLLPQSARDGRVAGVAARALGALCAVTFDASSAFASLDASTHVVTPAAKPTGSDSRSGTGIGSGSTKLARSVSRTAAAAVRACAWRAAAAAPLTALHAAPDGSMLRFAVDVLHARAGLGGGGGADSSEAVRGAPVALYRPAIIDGGSDGALGTVCLVIPLPCQCHASIHDVCMC